MGEIPSIVPSDPQSLWSVFYQFTQRPRPSKHEEKILDYIRELALDNDCEFYTDESQNCLVKKKGSKGRENEAPLLIQNHTDMVCDKLPEVNHDFFKDPISLKLDGEWLTTIGTTLGADNGIGCAAALALILDKDISHPPLELLFTSDEETGLNGALNLDTKNISAQRMLNLDSEMWGELTVGCAGGKEATFSKQFETQKIDPTLTAIQVDFSGLRGGHSGVDIHLQQGNAIKIMADFFSFCYPLHFLIQDFVGGKAHNIIPRTSNAIIWCKESDIQSFEKNLKEFIPKIQESLYQNDFLEGQISRPQENLLKSKSLNYESTLEVLKIIKNLPHGAHKYDLQAPNRLVRLSSNLAEFYLIDGNLTTINSYRFMDNGDKFQFELQYQDLAINFDLEYKLSEGYPNWKPEFGGKLLKQVQEVYKDVFDIDPLITAIHAGLECGIIKEKIEKNHPINMDIISFGPTIQAAHTPKERVHIPSVKKFWKLLLKTLERI